MRASIERLVPDQNHILNFVETSIGPLGFGHACPRDVREIVRRSSDFGWDEAQSWHFYLRSATVMQVEGLRSGAHKQEATMLGS